MAFAMTIPLLWHYWV